MKEVQDIVAFLKIVLFLHEKRKMRLLITCGESNQNSHMRFACTP